MPPGIGLDWRWMLNGSRRSTQVCIQSLAIIQQSRRMKSGSSEYSVLQRAEGEISTENTPNYTLKMVLKGCFVSNVIIILFTYSWIGYFQELCICLEFFKVTEQLPPQGAAGAGAEQPVAGHKNESWLTSSTSSSPLPAPALRNLYSKKALSHCARAHFVGSLTCLATLSLVLAVDNS